MLNINGSTITILSIIIFSLIVCPMIELITSSYKDSKIKCICIILFGFALSSWVFIDNYCVSCDSSNKEIELTRPISTSSTYATVAVSKKASVLRYIDKNGDEKSLDLSNNVKVHHEDSVNNKLLYIEKKYYNILNKKVTSEITKVTIYESKEVITKWLPWLHLIVTAVTTYEKTSE